MTRPTERRGVAERDGDGPRATARAVGLEVSRERYLRTTDRLRRCERTTRLAGWLGPVAAVLPGNTRRRVEVASADAREVLGKLWTAGERYRIVAERVDGETVDPTAGVDPDAFDDLRRRLTDAPAAVDAGEYGAVADTLAEARRTMRRLLDARYDDVGALSRFEPDRLRAAAAEAAAEVDTRRRERRGERETGGEAEEDLVAPVGNSDQIRPEAPEDENVDPGGIADLADDADDADAVDQDDLAAAFGIAPDEGPTDGDTPDEGPTDGDTPDEGPSAGTTARPGGDGETDDPDREAVEEAVGSSFEIDVGGDAAGASAGAGDADDVDVGGAAGDADDVTVAERETQVRDPAVEDSDVEGPDGEDPDGGFEFGVETEDAAEPDEGAERDG
jgi:hypothetical protein